MSHHKKAGIFFLFLILIFPISYLNAQQTKLDSVKVSYGYIIVLKDTVITPGQDTIIVVPSSVEYEIKNDPYLKSHNFYDSLRVKSSKKKWLAEIYRLSVRNPRRVGKDTMDNVKAEQEYLPYEGLIINEIYITSVDVLTGVINDTSITTSKGLSKFLNATHMTTQEKVIRKNLVFHVGESVNANRLADNERLLRSLNYIEDARIVVLPIDENMVDVMVVTKDMFPIGMSLSYSSITKFDIGISHRNIFGIGQEIKYRALFNSDLNPFLGHQLEYGLSNIANSFMSLYLKLRDTPISTTYYAKINRAFLTRETKYAGGIEFQYLRDDFALPYPDSTIVFSFKRSTYDIWLGRSFQSSVEKSRNFIISAKFGRDIYTKRPDISKDTNQYFQNASLLLGNIILMKSTNVKTRYIRGFGRTEDVPVGYIFSLTSGYYWSDIKNLYYGSFKFGYGYAFEKGAYLGLNSEYGSFIDKNGEMIQSVSILKLIWYTSLFRVNQSRLRIGGSFIYQEGKKRYSYEWIDLSNEVKGLSAYDTRGTSKTTLRMEATYFSNFYFYGFRFAPYVFTDLGLIRYNNPKVYMGKRHVGIGLGIRIRNESLVFPTFDLNFIFYTNNPTGDKIYRFNADGAEPKVFENLKVGEPYIIPYGVSNY